MSAVRLYATGPMPGSALVPAPRWTMTVERAENVEITRELGGRIKVTFTRPVKRAINVLASPAGDFLSGGETHMERGSFVMDETIDLTISPAEPADAGPQIHWHPA